MLLKVTKISVNNSQILVDDIDQLTEYKKEMAKKLGVLPSDIHFNYEEVEENKQ